ncbi:hypothetical protein KGF57_004975 [Candida theae]|uniref:Lysophospholipase n=1 Tax=Candida theae TaxID=1198502 RepID=A0AAD5BB14_9ASCO|nr:uncharacterized protein KGF57_004975 [Candida theae]KAI5949013.1 hypothetical protein KGF57_004975 [Candida theae]
MDDRPIIMSPMQDQDSVRPNGKSRLCPSSDILRVADSVSPEEQDWLKGRDEVTNKKLVEFLKYANMTDIDPEDYGNLNKSIHIGLAFSGGGYRAMLNGAGQLSALDERTKGPNGEKAKGLNGLLQASTYIAGLSGGSWMVGSIAFNNFTSVQDIVDHKTDIWDLKHSIVNYGGLNVVKTYKYYKSISDDQDAKEKAGFELSLTDTWGRALSHQFLSTLDDAGAGLTFSSIPDWDVFKNHEMPFPIFVSDARAPHTKIISINSTLIEFNPFEMGSFDASLFQFSKMKYLGTPLRNGKVNDSCYSGLDNAGFVMGSSSSLFNQFVLQINTTSLSSTIKSIITSFLKEVDKDEDDVAIYQPNPFFQTNVGKSDHLAQNETLTIVDGGEDGQNIPLNPLIQPVRDVDVIFAFDNSADHNNWPNGNSLTKTYARQFTPTGNGTIFPHVPDTDTFINLNLTAKPTFFGCDARNLSSLFQQRNISFTNDSDPYTVYDSPLVVYTANRPFSYWTNTSTFKLSYKDSERNSIIRNGFEVASRKNLTLDPEWPACVGCAIIRRHQERNGEEQTEQCKRCFERYCWDGSLDNSNASAKFNFTDQGSTSANEGTKVSGANSMSFSWTLCISENEKSWLSGRDKVTNEKIVEFLKYANMTDIDPEDYGNLNKSIHIGLAFSGGGYRAMLNGAGQMSALDERTNGPNGGNASGLNGLLQASTYIAGLSGGSWLVGSIVFNNFTSVQDIVNQNTDIWDLKHSIVDYGGLNVVKTYKYYKGISDDIDDKENAGFNTSFTDIWGRALAHQFLTTLNDTGASLTFSSVQDWDVFKNHEMPFPIFVSDTRAEGTKIINLNSSLTEFNPFEVGSFDKSIYQFANIKYLGTELKDGDTNGTCIGGYDNGGYIMGTSSTLFNQFLLQINTTSLPSVVVDVVTSLLNRVSDHEDDVAVYDPNPFYDTTVGASSNLAGNETLTLVDGGEDGQNVPLWPLIQPVRDVDVVFAFDNSADTEGSWPNGTSLIKTYERQFVNAGNGTIFPYVPDANSFINLNLTAKPTFFGCDAKNLTTLLHNNNTNSNSSNSYTVYDSPLVVYIANRPFSYWTNTSTFKLSYDDDERNSIIQNGFEVASRNNLTLDSEWPACVGCAIIRRSQERNGEEQSEQCKQCFQRYCWDGSLDSTGTKYNFTETGTTNGEESSLESVSSSSSTSSSSSSSHSGKKNDASASALNWSSLLGLAALVGLTVLDEF